MVYSTVCTLIFHSTTGLNYTSFQQLQVPVKCKLTVTRNSNDLTWTSILETRKLRVSSLESSLSSFESSRSSFESRWQRINSSIIVFPNTCTCQSCWFTLNDREKFRVANLEAVSDSTFVNPIGWLIKSIVCPSVELLLIWS